MSTFEKNLKEIFPSQIVSIIGGIIAGTILAIYLDKFLIIPGILILIPGFLEMKNSIGGSLAARISAGLHLKVINVNHKRIRLVKGNALAAFFLALIVSICLGLVAFLFNLLVFKIFFPLIIILPLIAVIISSLLEIPLAIFLTFYLFKKGHDPDYIMGPFITSIGDIIGIFSLLISIIII